MPVGPALDPLLNPDGALDLAQSKRVAGRTREATDLEREDTDAVMGMRDRATRARPWAKKALVVVVVLILLVAFALLGLSWLL